LYGSSTATGAGDTAFVKYDRNGQSDPGFGAGTGSMTVDLSAPLGLSSAREHIGQMTLDPDGEHVFIQFSVTVSGGTGPGRVLGSGIVARLTIGGALDAGFGRDGLTRLNLGFTFVAVQGDGAPLFLVDTGSIHRLLADDSPSPGILRVMTGNLQVDEFAGSAAVIIERLAGRDGAVSADFTTASRAGCHRFYVCHVDSATAGSDYTATSGRLDWADGDDSPRTVTVSILDDDIDEYGEVFGIDTSNPAGGVQLIAASATIGIHDNDVTPPPPSDPPPPPPPRPGGGGSVSWATALALLGLLLLRRRDFWQRVAHLQS
jgi:hypothetical protein